MGEKDVIFCRFNMVLPAWVWTVQNTWLKMKPKVCLTKKQQVEYWTQHLIQARIDGDTKKVKIYESLILKLGGVIKK